MTTTYLNKTFSTPTNRKKYTMAGWFKRSSLSSNQYFYSYDSGGNAMFVIGFYSTDKFTVYDRDASSGSDDINYVTTQVFRDTAAWYHFVVAVDTTDGTSGDRVKIYVNGERLTAFDQSIQPAQDYDTIANSAVSKDIGRWQAGSNYYYGYMSQFIFIDGSALTPSSFGSTNANGVWIPNTSPSVTYGNNGFKLDFADSGASAAAGNFGSDSSGNNHHFTSNNLADNPSTTDTPHNVFCTINELSQQPSNPATITQGGLKAENTSTANTDNNNTNILGTMYPMTGKWYMEIKYVDGYTATDGTVMVGLMSSNVGRATTYNHGFIKNNGNNSHTVGYGNNGKVWYNNSELLSGLTTYTTGDIMGIAMDLTNGKFFVSKNGTFFSNGTGAQDPANGTNPLYSSTNIQNPSDGMTPGIQLYSYPNGIAQMNYGNPSFSISSGNADANGYGNFEYAVPSGFYAMCSKNLAQYG